MQRVTHECLQIWKKLGSTARLRRVGSVGRGVQHTWGWKGDSVYYFRLFGILNHIGRCCLLKNNFENI